MAAQTEHNVSSGTVGGVRTWACSCGESGAGDGLAHIAPFVVPADPDRACLHEDFDCTVAVNRLTASDDDPVVIAYTAEIQVMCANCREPFRFIGVQAGQMPSRPMCSPDETELRAPIRPASADPDFGLGIPGFAVRFTERSVLEGPDV